MGFRGCGSELSSLCAGVASPPRNRKRGRRPARCRPAVALCLASAHIRPFTSLGPTHFYRTTSVNAIRVTFAALTLSGQFPESDQKPQDAQQKASLSCSPSQALAFSWATTTLSPCCRFSCDSESLLDVNFRVQSLCLCLTEVLISARQTQINKSDTESSYIAMITIGI